MTSTTKEKTTREPIKLKSLEIFEKMGIGFNQSWRELSNPSVSVYQKMSRQERILSSLKKWINTTRKTKNEEKFDDERGFSDLLIRVKCGYCFEYTTCGNCPLRARRKKGIFGKKIKICHADTRNQKSHFSLL